MIYSFSIRGFSMNETLFTELVASVKEGGAILRGEKEATRTTRHGAADRGCQTPRGGIGCGERGSINTENIIDNCRVRSYFRPHNKPKT
jgi:hypothetical protein